MLSDFDLLQYILIQKDRDKAIQEIDVLKEKIFENGVVISQIWNLSFLPYEKFQLLLQEKQVAESDLSAVSEILSDIKKRIEELPVMTITIPFEASPQLIQKIAQKLRSHNNIAILNIEKDTSLIAGAKLFFNGSYFDASLKTSLNTYFTEHPELSAI